jgi:alanine racemase
MPRPIRAAICAGALAQNLAIAKRHAGAASAWAVLKANAYGHGLERAAAALGVHKPILLLEGFFKPADVPMLHRHALTPVIHDAEQVEMLARLPPGEAFDVYLKLNSGMNRLGFTAESLQAAYRRLRGHPAVRAITLMTHFGDADGPGGIAGQLAVFEAACKPLGRLPRSLANSAALLRYPDETRGDWVRPGIMLYGCSPFAERSAESLGLRPVMTLASEIIALQRLRPGDRVGYGGTYAASGDLTIGIVACGYADGYPRHAPSGTPVLVNGKRTGTVGRVSMDMIAVDLSALPEAGVGTPVVLWGEGLSADEVAAAAGTLSYELLTKVTSRVRFVDG